MITKLERMKNAIIHAGAKCSTWHNDRTRCENPAVGVLLAPNGKAVPGGIICDPCATLCITEYAEKLGETWTLDRV